MKSAFLLGIVLTIFPLGILSLHPLGLCGIQTVNADAPTDPTTVIFVIPTGSGLLEGKISTFVVTGNVGTAAAPFCAGDNTPRPVQNVQLLLGGEGISTQGPFLSIIVISQTVPLRLGTRITNFMFLCGVSPCCSVGTQALDKFSGTILP